MDSRVVNKAIASQIKPLLKEQGFSEFTARSSWRYLDKRIDVVNFQSFNSYLAGGVGCTTYSFAVNLGIYFPFIPFYGVRDCPARNARLTPPEYWCHFRNRVLKSIAQKELKRIDVWYIDKLGRYLDSALQDVHHGLINTAFPWFDRFASLPEALRTLSEEKEQTHGTWGFGAKSSPQRSYLTGYVALELGSYALAASSLRQASDFRGFGNVRNQVLEALQRAEDGLP